MPGRKKIDFSKSRYVDKRLLHRRPQEIKKRHGIRGDAPKRPLLSVSVTSAVRNFAGPFPKTEAGIRQMIQQLVQQVKFVRDEEHIAKGHYMVQAAHDVLTYRKIPVIFAKDGSPIFGCNTMCSALAACLRAKKIPYHFVKTIARWERETEGPSHSVIEFKIGNRTFVSDPFPRHNPMQQVGRALREQIENLEKDGKWARLKHSEEAGIYSIEDMDKFNPRRRKK